MMIFDELAIWKRGSILGLERVVPSFLSERKSSVAFAATITEILRHTERPRQGQSSGVKVQGAGANG